MTLKPFSLIGFGNLIKELLNEDGRRKVMNKICKHQLYCRNNHYFVACPQEGCIHGECEECGVVYNPLFDCSELPDGEELPEALKGNV